MYTNPYQNLKDGTWCKANFHTHAGTGPGTCGSNPVSAVVDLYRTSGYDMLCISNHDIYTDTAQLTDDKILMIPGVEYSQDEHMLTIGVNESLHEKDHQTAINLTNDMCGFTILCHPNWQEKEYWSWEKLKKLTGYIGLEIINMLIYRLSGSGLATDTWDYLLSHGRLVYGFGNDDFHLYADVARSFSLIYCTERSYDSMKQAVENGAVCASTGLYPVYLRVENNIIKVKAAFLKKTYIDTYTYRFVTENGKVLSVKNGSSAEYQISGEKYVRVEVLAENGAMLFFQPIYKTEAFHENK